MGQCQGRPIFRTFAARRSALTEVLSVSLSKALGSTLSIASSTCTNKLMRLVAEPRTGMPYGSVG